jgi:chaperone BCS1
MSRLLALARTSLLGQATSTSIRDLLEQSTPGFSFLQGFFATWLKLDLSTLAAALTIFGTISGALGDLQGLALKVYWWFTRLFTASISVASSDRLNKEILNWIGTQVLTRQGTRILTARTETIQTDTWYPRRATERNDYHHEKRVPIQYLPTFGTTWFIHDYNVFLVRRIPLHGSYAPNVPDEYAAAPEGNEPLVIMCLGRSVMPIKRFLDHCRDFAEKQREAFITIRASKNQYHHESWDTTILRPIRPLETVHFDETTKAELVADIRNYLDPNTRRFYTARGIPYRRGYLLHGTPGTGKTSLSLALAGCFGLELYLCHLPSVREDNELERLFTALPPRCMVLLEDIDAVGIKRQSGMVEDNDDDDDDDDKFSRPSRCTLSGVLNVLDGVSSQEGRIVLMTSNMAHKLDKALVRPGRIDKMIYLGNISQRSAELMFLRMYTPDRKNSSTAKLGDEELQKLALEFSKNILDNTFTPAQLQGYLLNHRGSPVTAAAETSVWVEEEKAKMEEAKLRAKQAAEWRAKKRRAATMKLLAKNLKGSDLDTELDEPAATAKAEANGDAKKESTTTMGTDSEEEIAKEETAKETAKEEEAEAQKEPLDSVPKGETSEESKITEGNTAEKGSQE